MSLQVGLQAQNSTSSTAVALGSQLAAQTRDTASDVERMAGRFRAGGVDILEGTRILQYIAEEGMQFFGVKRENQEELDFTVVRSMILDKMGLSPETKTIQVVGDSAAYSGPGTAKGREFLNEILNNNPDALILWGFTGNQRGQLDELDVNQLVNTWIEEEPSRASRTLANVVDKHTVQAISEWKCKVSPSNTNFFLVYGDVNKGALFGDDVISSDSITDKLVLLEGGVQSFTQAVNCLSRDVEIQGVYNLRVTKNSSTYVIPEGLDIQYFGAAEFLQLLKDETALKRARLTKDETTSKEVYLTTDEVEIIRKSYLETHHLFNPYRPDGGTKERLFAKAWKDFTEGRLWEKLHLCNISKFDA